MPTEIKSKQKSRLRDKVTIVGAGPAGLFCSYHLLQRGFSVDLYDQSSGVAKKFLIAGNGGLNLTHSQRPEEFVENYGKNSAIFEGLLKDFSANDLRDWCLSLGIETFVGSSGRVFPTNMKAGRLLVRWLEQLKQDSNFNLHLKHRLVKVSPDKDLFFETPNAELKVSASILIFALGGGSWRKTGSDGRWTEILKPLQIGISPLVPMNCGFERPWSNYFQEKIGRASIKYVQIHFEKRSVKGDLMITPYGVEGGAIYSLSHRLRDQLNKGEKVFIQVDLRPDLSLKSVNLKLAKRSKKTSLSNFLRKALNIDKVTYALLREVLSPDIFMDSESLAKSIKCLELELARPRPIDEAISTAGGVEFDSLNENLESKYTSGVYFCGEMLDFEAPTGGYLLQGAFSSAMRVVKGISC